MTRLLPFFCNCSCICSLKLTPSVKALSVDANALLVQLDGSQTYKIPDQIGFSIFDSDNRSSLLNTNPDNYIKYQVH